MNDNETYEIDLTDKRVLNVTGDSYRALSEASIIASNPRYIRVKVRPGGHGTIAGEELIVNCDHVVTARKLG